MRKALSALFLLASLLSVVGGHHKHKYTLWAELPYDVSLGTIEEVRCYYGRLQDTLIEGAGGGSIQFGTVILRVEDPFWLSRLGSPIQLLSAHSIHP